MEFGNKEIFAIEIGFGKGKTFDDLKANRQLKCKTRFWANGKSVGAFKIYGELKYLKEGLKKIIDNEASMWENAFENKSDKEIYCEINLCSVDLLNISAEETKKYYYYDKYRIFFGDQFDGENMVVLIRDGKICFMTGLFQKEGLKFNDDLSSLSADFPVKVAKKCVPLDYFYEVFKDCFNKIGI